MLIQAVTVFVSFPRFSTAFSVKLIRLSAKTANILHPFTFPFYTITETTDFCVIVYFCLITSLRIAQISTYEKYIITVLILKKRLWLV